MFDESLVGDLATVTASLCATDFAVADTAQLRRLLGSMQASMDALATAHARAVGAFEAQGGHEQDGCARIGMWLRRQLRLTPAEVARRRRAAVAVRVLPLVGAAADAGLIRPEHVDVFGSGIAAVGPVVMTHAQDLLLPVARECDPQVLRAAVDALHAATDPDGPDRDWASALEKQDITCTRAGFGWHVRGFLDADTGAMLSTVLNAWARPTTTHPTDTTATTHPDDGADPAETADSAADGSHTHHGSDHAEHRPNPTPATAGLVADAHAQAHAGAGDDGAGDERPVARRRVEGLQGLLSAYLRSGLPSDKGIRPHLHISVDADTLNLALAGDRTTPTTTPPTLTGYGIIGRDLLTRLSCDAATTTILTDGPTDQHRGCPEHPGTAPAQPGGGSNDRGEQAAGTTVVGHRTRHACGCAVVPYVHVLDVGRTERTATPRQRLAVLTAQQHRCATPGCDHRHLEIHHIVPWADGGPSDLTNLIGLCGPCHTLLHRGLLHATPDHHGGATFTRGDGTPIDDIRRRSLTTYAERLRDHVASTLLTHHQQRQRPPPPPRRRAETTAGGRAQPGDDPPLIPPPTPHQPALSLA